MGAEKLPVQVMLFKNIGVHDDKAANTQSSQFFNDIAAQATAADNSDRTVEKFQLLPGGNDFLVSLVPGRKDVVFQGQFLYGRKGLFEKVSGFSLVLKRQQAVSRLFLKERKNFLQQSASADQREYGKGITIAQGCIQIGVTPVDKDYANFRCRDFQLGNYIPHSYIR